MKKTSGQFVIYIISSWMRCEAVFRFVVFQLIVYIFHGCGIQDAQSNRSVSIWFLSTTIAIGMTMTNWRHMQLPNIYTHFVQLYMEFSKMLDNFVGCIAISKRTIVYGTANATNNCTNFFFTAYNFLHKNAHCLFR